MPMFEDQVSLVALGALGWLWGAGKPSVLVAGRLGLLCSTRKAVWSSLHAHRQSIWLQSENKEMQQQRVTHCAHSRLWLVHVSMGIRYTNRQAVGAGSRQTGSAMFYQESRLELPVCPCGVLVEGIHKLLSCMVFPSLPRVLVEGIHKLLSCMVVPSLP